MFLKNVKMDQDDDLKVDLKGNVLTCQNVGLEKKHLSGHMDKMEEVRTKSSQHWTWRKECRSCPVVQLCQGSCMFLKKEKSLHKLVGMNTHIT